jgi:hypothetical protein
MNWTWTNIATAVESKPETVRKYYQRWKATASLPPKIVVKKSSVNGSVGLQIKSLLRDNPKISIQKIKQRLEANGTALSKSSVHRYLMQSGFISTQLKYEPLLSATNIGKRFLPRIAFQDGKMTKISSPKFFGLMKPWFPAFRKGGKSKHGFPEVPKNKICHHYPPNRVGGLR